MGHFDELLFCFGMSRFLHCPGCRVWEKLNRVLYDRGPKICAPGRIGFCNWRKQAAPTLLQIRTSEHGPRYAMPYYLLYNMCWMKWIVVDSRSSRVGCGGGRWAEVGRNNGGGSGMKWVFLRVANKYSTWQFNYFRVAKNWRETL